MIEFSKIIIEGFCSIPNLELQLNTNKITVIRGSNSFGKTSIFSAIVWALYGKNIKGISDVNTWKKYQPKDYQGTKVEIFFKKGNTIHQVIRCQEYKGLVGGSKGKNQLFYYIEAVQVENKGKLQIQALIEKDLEMSYNLFLNSIMFGQGLKRLIQESGPDKKKIFEEVFELQYLTKARALAYDKYSDIKSQVSALTSKIRSIENSHNDLSNLASNIKKENQEYLSKVAKKIKNLESEKNLSAKDLIKYGHRVQGFNNLELEIKEIKAKVDSKKKSIQNAYEKTNVSLKDLLERVIKILKAGDIKKALSILMSIRKGFDDLNKYRGELTVLENTLSDLRSKKSLADNAQYKIKVLKDRIKSLDNSISVLKSSKLKPKSVGNIKEKLKAYKKELSQLKEKEYTLSSELTLYEWAYNEPLSNNGIKAYLFESSLNHLNQALESYSEVLGFNIQFMVDLKSAKKDFNVLITKDSIDIFYEELSGGEKQLVNLAMAFAMNEVMNQAKGVNIAFLDEVFESLSSDNIEIVVGLIKKIYQNRSLFLITHQVDLPISNSKTLNVIKKQGLSYYE